MVTLWFDLGTKSTWLESRKDHSSITYLTQVQNINLNIWPQKGLEPRSPAGKSFVWPIWPPRSPPDTVYTPALERRLQKLRYRANVILWSIGPLTSLPYLSVGSENGLSESNIITIQQSCIGQHTALAGFPPWCSLDRLPFQTRNHCFVSQCQTNQSNQWSGCIQRSGPK